MKPHPHGPFLWLGALMSLLPVAVAAGPTLSATTTALGGSATYTGTAVALGEGTARVIVRTDRAGKPQSVAVALSPGALQGLPTQQNKKTPDGAWEYVLPIPKTPIKTGYREVVIDWNPHGHPPPHIYTVPHFDFHFYVIGPAEVDGVHFTGPKDDAAKVSDAAILAPGYRVIPETAIDKMGVHAVDTAAPELRGKPFTATFIYGYYRNRLIFLEPMVTRDFLLSRRDLSETVKTPSRYSNRAYYPATYRVHYDTRKGNHVIELGSLKPG